MIAHEIHECLAQFGGTHLRAGRQQVLEGRARVDDSIVDIVGIELAFALALCLYFYVVSHCASLVGREQARQSVVIDGECQLVHDVILAISLLATSNEDTGLGIDKPNSVKLTPASVKLTNGCFFI